MPPLIFDFVDIRSRMLGDDKPKPKPVIRCIYCSEPRVSHNAYCRNCGAVYGT